MLKLLSFVQKKVTKENQGKTVSTPREPAKWRSFPVRGIRRGAPDEVYIQVSQISFVRLGWFLSNHKQLFKLQVVLKYIHAIFSHLFVPRFSGCFSARRRRRDGSEAYSPPRGAAAGRWTCYASPNF